MNMNIFSSWYNKVVLYPWDTLYLASKQKSIVRKGELFMLDLLTKRDYALSKLFQWELNGIVNKEIRRTIHLKKFIITQSNFEDVRWYSLQSISIHFVPNGMKYIKWLPLRMDKLYPELDNSGTNIKIFSLKPNNYYNFWLVEKYFTAIFDLVSAR